MNKKILTVILLILLIAVLIAAAVWYNKLSSGFENPPQPSPEDQSTESSAETAPDITVYDYDEQAVKLSEKFGKPVILNFWASWCGPCKMEMPAFQSMYEAYGDKVEFMMVNLTGGRETVEAVRDLIELSGFTFPVYFDKDADAAVTYGLNSIPRTVFINPDGTVFEGHIGMLSEEALEQNIKIMLESN